MPQVTRPFPPSPDTLAALRPGEYIVYIGTEEEITIASPDPMTDEARHKVGQAKDFVAQEKLVSPETLAGLGPREMVMYELLHHTPAIAPYLQPLEPADYYDGENTLEFKLKPCSPAAIVHRRNVVHDAIDAKIEHYGLSNGVATPHDAFGTHTNISVWDRNGNLMDPTHPEYGTTTQHITGAIVKSLLASNDIRFVRCSRQWKEVTVGPSRTDDFRFAGMGDEARLEIRPARGKIAFNRVVGHIERAIEEAMRITEKSSALAPEHTPSMELSTKRRAQDTHADRTGKILYHALNGATIDPAKRLHISRQYVRGSPKILRGIFKGYDESAPAPHSADPEVIGNLELLADRLKGFYVDAANKPALPPVEDWKERWIEEKIVQYRSFSKTEHDELKASILHYINTPGQDKPALPAWAQEQFAMEGSSLHSLLWDIEPLKGYQDNALQDRLQKFTYTGASNVLAGRATHTVGRAL